MNRRKFLKRAFGGIAAVVVGAVTICTKDRKKKQGLSSALPRKKTKVVYYDDGTVTTIFNKKISEAKREYLTRVFLMPRNIEGKQNENTGAG